MAKASKTTRGVVLTLIGGTCWGFSGTCAKFLMDGYGVDPVWLVCVRQFFASWLFLALAAAVPGDRKRLRDLVRELGRGWRTLALVVVTAACMMVNSVCYIVTVKVTNSATATVLQTLALVVLMVYSCVTARRGPRRRELAGLALALGGTFLIATAVTLRTSRCLRRALRGASRHASPTRCTAPCPRGCSSGGGALP